MSMNAMKAAETLEPRAVRQSVKMACSRERGQKLHMADDDLGEGPVVVRRAAYDAGMKLEAEEKAGKGTAFTIAEDMATACREAGDTSGAA